MCKIITILNKGKGNEETINKLIKANNLRLCAEKSGYSVFRDNKTFDYIGDRAYNNSEENFKYKGEKVFIIHTRTRTSGSTDTDGLHLKTLDDRFVFAHNGIVSSFANVEKYSDSYYFFKRMIKKPLTARNISKAMRKYGFSGKGFLYDTKKDIMHYFCNSYSYIHALPDCLIITSYEMDQKLTEYQVHNVLGFEWFEKLASETIPVLKTEKIDDVYMKFKDLHLVEYENIGRSSDYWSDKEEVEADDIPLYNSNNYFQGSKLSVVR